MFLPIIVSFALFVAASGHARLWDPVNRNSAWRKGFPGPIDYNDYGDYCGRSVYDSEIIPEGCGACGPSTFPKSGSVVKSYKAGQQIEIIIEIMGVKKGYWNFRVCPSKGDGSDVTEDCFGQHKLTVLNSPNPTKPDRYELGQGKCL